MLLIYVCLIILWFLNQYVFNSDTINIGDDSNFNNNFSMSLTVLVGLIILRILRQRFIDSQKLYKLVFDKFNYVFQLLKFTFFV